jgi:hypothetical protein
MNGLMDKWIFLFAEAHESNHPSIHQSINPSNRD